MKLTKYLCAGLLAGAAMTGAANAATCQAQAGGPNTVSYDLTQGGVGMDFIVDVECFSNANDSNTISPTFDIFGSAGWLLGDKVGDEGGGDGNVAFDNAPLEFDDGVWSLTLASGFTASDIFVVLKQANSFAAFLLDINEPYQGFWSTLGPSTSVQDLSHASVYYKPGEPAPIPLPAAGWLLIAALGGLAVARKRA